MDSADDDVKGLVAETNEGGVEAVLCAVVVGVEVALRTGVAAAMLVITLIGSDEGVGRHIARAEVSQKTIRARKTDDATELTFLNAAEIDEGIVLGGIELDESLLFTRDGARNVALVGEEAVREVDLVGTRRRQTLLVALPGLVRFGQLVGDSFANCPGYRGERNSAVNIEFTGIATGRALDFVDAINRRDFGICARAPDGTNQAAWRIIGVGNAGAEIREAIGIVPIGVVV
jgi:hypothetical protein